MVIKKLFPKKKSTKEATQAKLKMVMSKLETKIKDYDSKSKICKTKAKKFLKAGNKEAAKTWLVRGKLYQTKSIQYNGIIVKLQRQSDAMDEAGIISETSNVMGETAKELKKVAATVNPEKAMEITEDAEESIEQISEAGELLAGNIEEESGVDIDEDLAQLETEVMLEDAGKLPDAPEEEEESDSMILEDKEKTPKSKEALKDEIAKLKKELDMS